MVRQILLLLGIRLRPRLKVYTYGFYRYPFDNEQRFYLDAEDDMAADNKAGEIMKAYIENGWCVMRKYWRIDKKN